MTPEEQVDAVALAAMTAIGPDLVQIIRDEISDAFPPASAPLTPPHLRSGNLRDKIHFTVDEFHDGATLTLISDADYSVYLQKGTRRMSRRDFFGDEALERIAAIALEKIQAFIDGSGAAPPVNSAFGMIYPAADAFAA